MSFGTNLDDLTTVASSYPSSRGILLKKKNKSVFLCSHFKGEGVQICSCPSVCPSVYPSEQEVTCWALSTIDQITEISIHSVSNLGIIRFALVSIVGFSVSCWVLLGRKQKITGNTQSSALQLACPSEKFCDKGEKVWVSVYFGHFSSFILFLLVSIFILTLLDKGNVYLYYFSI